jgi:hypothetical protein
MCTAFEHVKGITEQNVNSMLWGLTLYNKCLLFQFRVIHAYGNMHCCQYEITVTCIQTIIKFQIFVAP